MSIKLIIAIIAMTLALVFYTIGVFSEKKSGVIKLYHLIFFILGLICDASGTYVMKSLNIVNEMNTKVMIHTITGSLALILMAFHAIWGGYTLFKGSEKSKQNFHRFSIVVWSFWLIPYVLGMVIGMTK